MHIRTGAWDLAGEALALAVVVAGAVVLSRSCLTLGEDEHPSYLGKPAVGTVAGLPWTAGPDVEPALTGCFPIQR